ncbi:MAG: efflux RND transporter periplasmic adaptor subunit [Parvularculaceae bacterium]|nr:efflux RND transporter periplasmic adaptor subunit [Parvularculaceae bacterium]
MIRKFITVLSTVGILAAGLLLIGLMGAARPRVKPQAPVITPPSVFYAAVEPQSVTLDVFAQGEVRPRTDITLTAQVSGRVVFTSAAFVDGGAFNEGDLLLKIEDADYRLAVTSARSRVAQAEESLKREEAEAALARRDYEELGRKGDPSELTLRLPQLAQARAAYDAARADFKSAELDLERTEIRAPFKGRVRERLVGQGQYVGPGAQLGRIFSIDAAEIRLTLTDNDLGKLGLPFGFVESAEKPGPEVLLTGSLANVEHQWRGRIARTEGAIDPSTRQIAAIAVVDDPYGAGAAADGTPLAVGLFVDAKIAGKVFDGAFVIPRSALYGRDTVYVIGPGDVLEKRSIVIASAERDRIVVSSGLKAGDRVVTSPLRGADAGSRVVPVDPTKADRSEGEVDPTPQDAAAAAYRREGGP